MCWRRYVDGNVNWYSHYGEQYKVKVKVKSLSRVRFFVNAWTVAHQALLSMGILQSRILAWVTIFFFRGSCQARD